MSVFDIAFNCIYIYIYRQKKKGKSIQPRERIDNTLTTKRLAKNDQLEVEMPYGKMSSSFVLGFKTASVGGFPLEK